VENENGAKSERGLSPLVFAIMIAATIQGKCSVHAMPSSNFGGLKRLDRRTRREAYEWDE
jgi:hypothetical protein